MPAQHPVKIYDFAAFSRRTPTQQPPGDRIDAQFENHAASISALITLVGDLQRQITTLRTAPAPKGPTLPTPKLYVNAGGPYAADDDGATATSADYAQVSITWAEWMPDTIPDDILAINAISGDHWSARWWAHRAGEIVTSASRNPTIQSLYYQAVAGQTQFSLHTPDLFNVVWTRAWTSISVFKNGLLLTPSNGTVGAYTIDMTSATVTLLSAAAADDLVSMLVSWQPSPPTGAPVSLVTTEDLVVTSTNTFAPLHATWDQGVAVMFVNGRAFFAPDDFTVVNRTVDWLNTTYAVTTYDDAVMMYSFGAPTA